MINLMPGEYFASFEIRKKLFINGTLTNQDIPNLMVLSCAPFGRVNWRLYPKSLDGQFLGALLQNILASSNAIDYLSKDNLLINYDTHVKINNILKEHTYVLDIKYKYNPQRYTSFSLYWCYFFLRNIKFVNLIVDLPEYDQDYHFRRAFRTFRKKVTYCPECAKEQVHEHGFMWFLKKECKKIDPGHLNVDFIGCPICHGIDNKIFINSHEKLGDSLIHKKKYYAFTNRVEDTMKGICRYCKSNIWNSVIGYSEHILGFYDYSLDDSTKSSGYYLNNKGYAKYIRDNDMEIMEMNIRNSIEYARE